jgi:hypothetical protein
MQQYTDLDLYYLLLTFLRSDLGILVITLSSLFFIALIGVLVGIFRSIAIIRTDCESILNNKNHDQENHTKG